MNPEILLAGSFGALTVFLLGFVRDSLRQRRELRGLTRLVHTEMEFNRLTLRELYNQPERAITEMTTTLEMSTWESARMRMAAMMPADDLGSVTYYYLFVQELKRVQGSRELYPHPEGLAAHVLDALKGSEPEAIQIALQYSNMRGFLGWYRMRYKILKYRKAALQAEKEQT